MKNHFFVITVNQNQQDTTSMNKRKRGTNGDNIDVGNTEDEEELLYVPVYSDSEDEFLERHKFSTASKRSTDASQEPQEKVEEFSETYGK